MKKNIKNLTITILVALSTISSISYAEEIRKQRKPPQEAIDACAGKSEGDQVSFVTDRGHNLSGTCQNKGKGLVAVPKNKPKRQ